MNKPSIVDIAVIAAALFIATLALWAQPVKADPLTQFLDRVLAPRPAPLVVDHARRHRVVAHWRTPLRGRAGPERAANTMIASYYGAGEKLNARTANGERFNPGAFTAAHRSLPFGTRLSVCHRGCVAVRVNDRGPAAWTGRSLDLSHAAARAIGMTAAGVARVHVVLVGE